MPWNKESSVTSEVVSVLLRASAAKPKAAVVPTPPKTPMSQIPTRRSFIVVPVATIQAAIEENVDLQALG
jgi:hypothetical protein